MRVRLSPGRPFKGTMKQKQFRGKQLRRMLVRSYDSFIGFGLLSDDVWEEFAKRLNRSTNAKSKKSRHSIR